MCGIDGFWGPPDHTLLEAMTAAQVAHRGPDDVGFLETDHASLGFRRLSIIDLVSGHQPMSTDDGLVHISYNGEVYNYRELRAELEALGHQFHTTCDTEVVLHAYAEWGTDCFARFNGMWGVAFLDLRGDTPQVVLARDHFGIKPMYYAQSGRAACCSRRRSRRSCRTRPSSGGSTTSRCTSTSPTASSTTPRRRSSTACGPSGAPRSRSSTTTACRVERYWEPVLSEDRLRAIRPSSAPCSIARSSAGSWPTCPSASA